MKITNPIKINNIVFNRDFLYKMERKYLYRLISMLRHETIHKKIFKVFKLKSRFHIIGKIVNKNVYINGFCVPNGELNEFLFFLLDLVHFIFDIIEDIFIDNNFKYVILDCVDYFNFTKNSIKTIVKD